MAEGARPGFAVIRAHPLRGGRAPKVFASAVKRSARGSMVRPLANGDRRVYAAGGFRETVAGLAERLGNASTCWTLERLTHLDCGSATYLLVHTQSFAGQCRRSRSSPPGSHSARPMAASRSIPMRRRASHPRKFSVCSTGITYAGAVLRASIHRVAP